MKKILVGLAVSTLLLAANAQAEIVRLPFVKVVDVLINDGSNFGGCMARIEVDVSRYAPSCRGGTSSYVAFSCTGELQDADSANRMFEVAQMGLLVNRTVRFEVDTNKQHGGYCLATRAEIK